MATRHNGKIQTDGLVFHFDAGDIYNSYLGRPTTNLVGDGMSNYNNVSSSVRTDLTTTGEYYKGAPIYKQVLTPLDASGVSWLTGGNNPGLGVVHSGGGGTANRYTGFSIFYKPTVPMHSTPIFLSYSNIGGWQCSSCPPEDMGDGWFRAYVLWYNTVTQSDGKYWAINPATASLNVPITIYWAGPFKEDLNVQNVSQYINGTRSATQGLKDLTGNNTLDLSNVTFNAASTDRPRIVFDGSNDYINIPSSNLFDTQTVTVEVVVKPYAISQNGFWFEKGAVNTQYSLFMEGSNIVWRQAGNSQYCSTSHMTVNQWNHVVGTFKTGERRTYVNGQCKVDDGLSYTMNTGQGNQFIGSYNSGGYHYNGEIAVVKVYNRVLTAEEIHKNYLHYKERFSMPNISPSIGSNVLGNSSTSAAPSARLLKEMGYTTSGNYWLQPTTGTTPFLAYVEFDTSGGDPWVHVGTIDDEDAPSNNSTYHKWSGDMNSAQSCPPWDDESTFGGATPTFVSDYKNAGWNTIPFTQIMIKDAGNTQRKLLYTNEGQIKSSNSSLKEWFASLKWGAVGSDTSNSAVSAQRVKVLNITNYGVNDPVLQSSGKTKLLFKYGEIDGAQDGNKDRTMIAWHRHDAADGVDGPSGLGCFTNRSGAIDYRDIVPGSVYGSGQDFPPANIGGSYYYSIWIR